MPDRPPLRPEVTPLDHAPSRSPLIHLLACEIGRAGDWTLGGPCQGALLVAVASFLQLPMHVAPKTRSRRGLGTVAWEFLGGQARDTLSESCTFRICDWLGEGRLRAWTL